MGIFRSYEEDAIKTLLKAPYVDLDAKDAARLYKFAEEFQKQKAGEHVHNIDNEYELKRYITGFAAEIALEKFLGIKILDTTFGKSENYHHADLKQAGINIGIKCSLFGNYPVVFNSPNNAEIITVLKDTRVYICGVATIKAMKEFSDENLILNAKFKARGVKSGFYGFDQLIPFKNLDELKNIYKNLPKKSQRQTYR
jgi:hypothetical protein